MRISTLRWAVGAFCAAVGALMLVAPHQFSVAAYATLRLQILWWGGTFLLAGAALIGAAAFAPRRGLVIMAHGFAGVAVLALATGFISTATWTATLNYGVLGLGTLLAPFLISDQQAPAGRRDLFAALLGMSSALNGVVMLALPGQFGASAYDLIRPYLPWCGVIFLASGLALIYSQLSSRLSRAATRLAHLVVAGALLAFLVAVPLPNRHWTGIIYFGGFAALLAALPWYAQRLQHLDPASLRTRLALALGVAAALPLILLTAADTDIDRRGVLAESLALHQFLATSVANDVADYVDSHRSVLATVATRSGFSQMPAEAQVNWLQALSRAYPDTISFATYDATGNLIARSNDRATPSVAGRPVFEDVRRTNVPSLAILQFPRVEEPVIMLGAPIHDPAGRFAGFVGTSLGSERPAMLLLRATTNTGVEAHLLDDEGRMIAHSGRSKVPPLADFSQAPLVAAVLAAGDAPGSFVFAASDGDRIAGYARVPGLRWTMVVERPMAAALARTYTAREVAFGGLIVAIAVAGVFGVLAADRLTGPLATLTRAVDAVAAGGAFIPLQRSAITEVAHLAAVFADMRDRLAARTLEQEAAEQALRESETRFRALLENASDIVSIMDADGTLRYESPAAERILGSDSTKNRLGKNLFAFFHPDDVERVRPILPEFVRRPGAVERVTFRFRHADGSWRTLEAIGHNLLHDPVIHGIVINSRDITERRHTEEALERLSHQNELILTSAGEGILGIDRTGKGAFANPAAARLTGYRVEDLIGYPLHDLLHHSRPDGGPYPLEECPCYAALQGSSVRRVIGEVYWRKDGTSFPVEYTVASIQEHDQTVGAVIIFSDVTDIKQMEQRLTLLSEAVEEAPDGFQVVDLDGRILYSNKAVKEIYGFTPEELQGKHVNQMNADPEVASREIIPTLKATGRWVGELMAKHKDGSIFPIWLTTSMVKDRRGQPIALAGVIRDITARKRMEEALQETSETLRALIQASPLAIIALDLAGNVRLWNPAAERFFGWKEDEVLGRPNPLVPEERRAADRARRERVLRGAIVVGVEVQVQKRDGSPIDISFSGAPLYDAAGNASGTVAVVADITERKRIEEQTRKALTREQVARARAEQLAAERATILTQIADGVIIADATGRRVFANEAACRLHGIRELPTAEGFDWAHLLFTLDGQPYPKELLPLQRAACGGEAVVGADIRIRQPDGTEIVVRGSAQPVVTEDGIRLGAVLTLHDITAQIELERQKDEFLANVSHDLRTPLAAIMASIGVVLANEPAETPEPIHRMLVNIDLASARMAKLVDDLLELTRLQAGRVQLRRAECDLREVAESCASAIEPLAHERHQQVRVQIPPDPILALVDAERLERALLNLLSNAHKYGRDGGIIQLTVERRSGEAVFTVADDGPGVPEADQRHIFERFYRSGTKATRREQGSGLGLAISRAMVELHGGRIWFRSALGLGTTFWIALPLLQADEVLVTAESRA